MDSKYGVMVSKFYINSAEGEIIEMSLSLMAKTKFYFSSLQMDDDDLFNQSSDLNFWGIEYIKFNALNMSFV